MPRLVKKLLGTRLGQAMLAWQVKGQPFGPDLEEQSKGMSVLVGDVRSSASGASVSTKLYTRCPYWLTAETMVLTAENVLAGIAKSGFQTPAMAFDSDFVLAIEGSEFIDL